MPKRNGFGVNGEGAQQDVAPTMGDTVSSGAKTRR